MQNNEPTKTATSPDVSVATEASKAPAAATTRRAGSNKLILIIIAAVVVVALIVGAVILVLNSRKQKQAEIEATTYSIERDPETGERPLFGSDETKDNSGEAFVDFQNRIIAAGDSTNEEVFDAKISQVVYYTAVEQFDEAEKIMSGIDQNTLSADMLSRYNNVMANLYEAKGDSAKAAEYRALVSE